MRVLVLDISSKTGWADLVGEMGSRPEIRATGIIENPKTVKQYGSYPQSYLCAAEWMVDSFVALIGEHRPDRLVVEETNKGKNRYSQKYLEFMHCLLIQRVFRDPPWESANLPVEYVSSGDWRKNQGLYMSKEDKKRNAKLAKAKREAAAAGVKLDKKKLGIRGKKTKKHIAIDHANAVYGLNLKPKDDDIADAICVGLAYFNNVTVADGK